jgi:hypothetical protein
MKSRTLQSLLLLLSFTVANGVRALAREKGLDQ